MIGAHPQLEASVKLEPKQLAPDEDNWVDEEQEEVKAGDGSEIDDQAPQPLYSIQSESSDMPKPKKYTGAHSANQTEDEYLMKVSTESVSTQAGTNDDAPEEIKIGGGHFDQINEVFGLIDFDEGITDEDRAIPSSIDLDVKDLIRSLKGYEHITQK